MRSSSVPYGIVTVMSLSLNTINAKIISFSLFTDNKNMDFNYQLRCFAHYLKMRAAVFGAVVVDVFGFVVVVVAVVGFVESK